MEKDMEKNKIIKELIKIFWIFIIGSIIGYIFETIVVIFQKGHFEIRQGLIYGPLIPVYGIGGMIYYIVFKKIKTRNKMQVFIISMILGGLTEYIASYIQEMIFHTVSWDYSYLPFNLNGRTSLLHCSYWGIAGILYIMYIEPLTIKAESIIKNKWIKIITVILVMLTCINIVISCAAAIRQKDRLRNIEARNKIEKFLDIHYPDEYMNKIFSNKKDR